MDREPTEPTSTPPPPEDRDERPPLGSWVRMYAVVLGVLLVQIVVFHLFTRAFE